MKTFTTILLLTFCIYTQKASAQICYSWDNAGNRIQHSTDCSNENNGGGGGGGLEMMRVDSASTDSIINLTEALYPNPTAGPVNIIFNNPVTNAQVTVVDNVGRQLYNTTISGANVPLDLSNLAQGIYYVTVKTGNNIFENSIVKQ